MEAELDVHLPHLARYLTLDSAVLQTSALNNRAERSDRIPRSACPECTRPKDIEARLTSHLVPYQSVNVAGPYGDLHSEELTAKVQPDFTAFLNERAKMITAFISAVWDGEQSQLQDVLAINAL